MSSLIRRMERAVARSQPHIRLDENKKPVRSKKGGFVFYTNPPKRLSYRGLGSKLGFVNPEDPCRLKRSS